jgi:general secretion pathway protein G
MKNAMLMRRLLFVSVIVAAFGTVGCEYQDHRDQSQTLRNSILIGLEQFKLDTGRYPTEREGLEVLFINPGTPGWVGPYLTKEVASRLKDFKYVYDGKGTPEVQVETP